MAVKEEGEVDEEDDKNEEGVVEENKEEGEVREEDEEPVEGKENTDEEIREHVAGEEVKEVAIGTDEVAKDEEL